jgi:hypothetical protein
MLIKQYLLLNDSKEWKGKQETSYFKNELLTESEYQNKRSLYFAGHRNFGDRKLFQPRSMNINLL